VGIFVTGRNRAVASVAAACLLALGVAGCHEDRPPNSQQPMLPLPSQVEASYGPQTVTWTLANGYVDQTISTSAFSVRAGCRGSGTLKIGVTGTGATKHLIDLNYACTGRLGEMWALYSDPGMHMTPPYTISVSADGDVTDAEYFLGP
jgi:hypothetical protein